MNFGSHPKFAVPSSSNSLEFLKFGRRTQSFEGLMAAMVHDAKRSWLKSQFYRIYFDYFFGFSEYVWTSIFASGSYSQSSNFLRATFLLSSDYHYAFECRSQDLSLMLTASDHHVLLFLLVGCLESV